MYGTIAHFQVKPGEKEEFVKAMDNFGQRGHPRLGGRLLFSNG